MVQTLNGNAPCLLVEEKFEWETKREEVEERGVKDNPDVWIALYY